MRWALTALILAVIVSAGFGIAALIDRKLPWYERAAGALLIACAALVVVIIAVRLGVHP